MGNFVLFFHVHLSEGLLETVWQEDWVPAKLVLTSGWDDLTWASAYKKLGFVFW
jgi:hypothetical protein